ncbi:Serine/threonine-protein kinase hal4 [Pleurostoma richardsiae]|uniref:non-specific serine/threonine protein kinase n=1 Tax=Pleurostoma richardsiae TaxID=41990 RepID=A0AA38VUL7_9PEZI|nr:Serine/threonine-protein kinase hal4 [Pleurostoma richardsiae]
MASNSDAKSTTTVASTSASSQPSSIKSVELPTRSPKLGAQNGQAANGPIAPADQVPRQAEKASVKDRLTRMFSTRDTSSRSVDSNTSTRKPQPGTISQSPSGSGSTTPPYPQPPSRKPSQTDKAPEKTAVAATKPAKPTNGSVHVSQRFVVNPDVPGGHEHHLKSSRRQEKLTDMFKGLLGKKIEQVPDSDLSLVSSWVDTLKQEKDSLASDKKGGPNATATLVEKYGKCQEVVGRGAFGIVRISHKKMEGLGEKLFAVKEFRRRPEETEKKYSKRLTAEFCISSSLRHPNVIHTLDLLKDSKGDYCEVMEFCAGGDLYTLVLAAGKLEVQEADCFFKQMMRGVEYMHEMGVAHRDLKPENLLLTTHGGLKITDFGNGECFRMAWENDPHMVSGLCGSAPYIAPEEYIDKEFDARAVDVWACGVIYMAMRTGRHLWRVAKKDEDEFYNRYLEGRRDEEGYGPIESLHRARCRNVIYSILDPNPSRRITASQVLKSEWGREIKLCKAGEEGL